jgi:hypothetical protein
MIAEKTISQEDIEMFLFTDSVADAVEHIHKNAVQGFGLKKRKKMRPFSMLGEHKLKAMFLGK